MDTKRDILARVYLSFIGIALLGFLVLGRAVYIQRVEGSYWRAMSDSMRQRFVSLDAQRGTIYTENGEMLSTSIPTFDVYFDFQADGLKEKKGKRFYEKIDSFARSMSAYFGDRSAAAYATELKTAYQRGDRYYSLKKKLSFDQYKAFRKFPLANLGRNKSGLIVEVNSKRLVPYGLLASRTVGLSREYILSAGKVKKMNVGLEKSYDSLLSGRDGQRMVQFVAPGTAVPIEGTETEPLNGKDIYTTLDLAIQDITEQALLTKLQQIEAIYGTAIVMETATGKIKAIANLGRRPDGSYWEDDNYALRNTEPGSTIKLATLLAVLEKGSSIISDTVSIGSTGKGLVASKWVTDAERSPKPVLTVQECFSHSSNIGMSRLALKAFGNKPTEIKEYLKRYGMIDRLPIDLTDLPMPRVNPLDQKGSSVGNMLWISFGYGLLVSPIHTLTLYNAVANQGKMMKPYLVSSIRQGGVIYRQFDPTVLSSAIARKEVIESARQALESVVTEGTARAVFKDVPFTVAGKTGTAQVYDDTYKYSDGVYQASFAGYFPADRPQFTCVVLVRTKPGSKQIYGGLVAAPVFKEIATRLHAMYVVSPQPVQATVKKDSSSSQYAGNRNSMMRVYASLGMQHIDSAANAPYINVRTENATTQWQAKQSAGGGMPDLRDLTLRDAVQQIEKLHAGIQIEVKGKGKIKNQSVQPGEPVTRGSKLILELN